MSDKRASPGAPAARFCSALSESEIQQLYNEGEVCEDRYDEGYDDGYETGKQYCIDNPEACGF